jgi:hypothetical protein
MISDDPRDPRCELCPEDAHCGVCWRRVHNLKSKWKYRRERLKFLRLIKIERLGGSLIAKNISRRA